MIEPITIYYPSYRTQANSSQIATRKSTVPAKAPNEEASIKPITIYYRVPATTTNKPAEVIKSSEVDAATQPTAMSKALTAPPATIAAENAIVTERPLEIIKSPVSVDKEIGLPAATQVPGEKPVGSLAPSEELRPQITSTSEAAKTVETDNVLVSDSNDRTTVPAVATDESKTDMNPPSASVIASPAITEQTIESPAAAANSEQSTPVNARHETSPEAPAIDTRAGLPAIAASDTIALNNFAIRLTSEARYDEAALLLKRAIGIAPNTFGLYRNLSIVYENMGRLDDAFTAAQKAVELAPEEPSALVQLCGLEVLTGQNTIAVSCYEKLRETKALDPMSQTFYGVALLRSQRSEDAIKALEKALLAEPANAAALNALGVAHFNDRKFESAAAFFKRAVEVSPEQGEIRFNLAIAHLALRNKEGAMSQYRVLKVDEPKIADRLYRILFRDKIVFLDKLEVP